MALSQVYIRVSICFQAADGICRCASASKVRRRASLDILILGRLPPLAFQAYPRVMARFIEPSPPDPSDVCRVDGEPPALYSSAGSGLESYEQV